MTIDEARGNVGNGVAYRPFGDDLEEGVITSVGEKWVLVRYGGEETSKATDPAALTLLGRRSAA